jgi:hypothetical protein
MPQYPHVSLPVAQYSTMSIQGLVGVIFASHRNDAARNNDIVSCYYDRDCLIVDGWNAAATSDACQLKASLV